MIRPTRHTVARAVIGSCILALTVPFVAGAAVCGAIAAGVVACDEVRRAIRWTLER